MIDIVSATKLSSDDFWENSALGISLNRLSHEVRIRSHIFFENSRGLSDVFNEFIEISDSDGVILFIHDDVWIDDYFIVNRVDDAVRLYDIFGVVGNKRQLNCQPSWAFLTIDGVWDDQENLSGAIAHGPTAFGKVGYFGTSPVECELLDGVFIGVKKEALKKSGVRFDSKFKFHFYDVDFCMSARKQGLKIGTWPIALTHQSAGGYNQDWRNSYKDFLKKWSDDFSENTEYPDRNYFSKKAIHSMKQTPAHTLINQELMNMIPSESCCIVDVGCMHGQMANIYKKQNPAVKYIGIDIDPDYATVAAQYCDYAIAADIESMSDEDFLKLFPSDCWIFGDCLEHLKDPWLILKKIRLNIDTNGCVLVCMPNAQHWGIQSHLLSGQFRYEDSGLMDRTHLRWFTLTTMLEMFRDTGWAVVQGLTRTLPVVPQQERALAGIKEFAIACDLDPEVACRDAQPFQYMFKLIPA